MKDIKCHLTDIIKVSDVSFIPKEKNPSVSSYDAVLI